MSEHLSEAGHDDPARIVLEEANQNIPANATVLARYAKLLEEMTDKKLALVPYGELIALNPEDPKYYTLRGNVFLTLDLNDLAMRDYRTADELSKSKQAWIKANIGNLLKNRGLYRDGIEYLNQAIELGSDSQYSHERLATALKLRDEQEKTFQELFQEARKEIVALKLKEPEADSSLSKS